MVADEINISPNGWSNFKSWNLDFNCRSCYNAVTPTIGGSLVSIGILGFAFGTLFSLVTLPVEFDASKRAIYWLERKRIVNQRELVQSKEALNWAAGTYVVAALASIANLVYLWMRFGKRN